MDKLPLKVRDVFKAVRQITEEVDRSVAIVVAGETGVGKKEIIHKLGAGAAPGVFDPVTLSSKTLSPGHDLKVVPADLVLVILDATQYFDEPTTDFVRYLRALQKPFLIVVNKIDATDAVDALVERIHGFLEVTLPMVAFVSAAAGVGVEDELVPKIVDAIGDKDLALATSLPICRSCVADGIIKRTAWQNGLIGGVTFLPGMDMPVLTANQAKMVLRLAAAYDQEITPARAKELLFVVGSGYTFRTIARQLLDFVPGPGWVIKGGVAYGGTMALGKAAKKYFELGGLGKLKV